MKNASTEMTPFYNMLRLVSRTFALSIEQLPRELRNAMTLAYLLFRVADYLEDNRSMTATRKAELLLLWEKILAGTAPAHQLPRMLGEAAAGDHPEAYVARRSPDILRQLEHLPADLSALIREHVRQTARGMACRQLKGPLIASEEELDDYMHYVAGIVGYLTTELFAYYSPRIRAQKDKLMPLGRECGLALQTVNIIRGLRKDWGRGWVFVPRSFYERLGLSPCDLFEAGTLERSMQVIGQLADKAERHLQHGLRYVRRIPRSHHRVRLACIWPLCFAAKTLAISRDNPQVLRGEVKISRAQVRRIVAVTSLMGWSNRWLGWYYDQLMTTPSPHRRAPA